VTGPAGYFADFAKVFSGFDSTLLSITAVIVIVILLVTYRSPVLWLLPLTTVFVALTAAQAVIYLLARNGGLTVNGQSAFILTVLVFGAGTDYALLLTARYREELRRHADRHQAMAVALGRAAPAIIASGATVILSLLCLLVAELASTRSLGPVMAIGVAVGLGAMLTLLPALLVIVGRWVFWPRRPTLGSAEPTERGLWARIGQRVARRPRLVWVVTAVVLGLLALGTTGLEANGLQSKDSFRTKPEAVTGEAVLARHFAAGAGNPVQVIGRAEAAGQLQATLAGTAGVTAVTRPVLRDGSAYLEGTLTSSPDSQASYDLVDRLRVSVHAIGGAEAKVGGAAPSTSTSSGPPATTGTWWCRWCWSWWPSSWACCCGPWWPVAAGGHRGAVVRRGAGGQDPGLRPPVRLRRGRPGVPLVDLCVPGRVGYRLQHLPHDPGPRGERAPRDPAGGPDRPGRHRRVITSAGVVLAGTFAALGTLPLVFVTEIGFVVAFGVLLDTFVVRSVLVTALNLDAGRRIWWPSSLSRTEDVTLDQLAQEEPAAMTP